MRHDLYRPLIVGFLLFCVLVGPALGLARSCYKSYQYRQQELDIPWWRFVLGPNPPPASTYLPERP